MKNNSGITLVALIVTIIVIIILASFTIFDGITTVKEAKVKEAQDLVKAIYLAIIQYEDEFGAETYGGTPLSEYTEPISNRILTDDDLNLLHIEGLRENTEVSFDRISLENSPVVFTFNYVDRAANINLTGIEHSYMKDVIADVPMSDEISFNMKRQVNEPVKMTSNMIAVTRNGNDVINTKTEKWYSYKANVSEFAKARIDNDIYAWIPRFAYRIHDMYLNHSYSNVPTSAVQIIFLRENTNQTADGSPLPAGYAVHPAFTNGATEYAGFWVKVEPQGTTSSYATAYNSASVSGVGDAHLMKNSEYGALALLSYALGNTEINFSDGKEYVACNFSNSSVSNTDVYSVVSDSAANYILSIRGHALFDTYWNVPDTLGAFMPTETSRIVRDVASGGFFYFEVINGSTTANYRPIVPIA